MNHKKKKIFLVLLMVFGATCCFAKQISFQLVEHNNSATEVSEEVYYLEEEILNSFFENGYIVTNSLPSLSDSKAEDKDLYTIGITDAVNGGAEIFGQVILYFSEKKSGEEKENIMVLEKIKFTFTTIDDLKQSREKSWKCNIDIVEAEDILNASETLIDALHKAINA